MFENYNDEINRRKAITGLLIQMISSDGDIAPKEQTLVLDIALQLGLSKEDIEEVIKSPAKFDLQPPHLEEDRMTILYYFLFTMAVDGEIHEEEEKLCYKIGLRLGFNEHLTRDLIKVMKKFLNQKIPKDALLNEIKKHMN